MDIENAGRGNAVIREFEVRYRSACEFHNHGSSVHFGKDGL
jgi:hypothetical protein